MRRLEKLAGVVVAFVALVGVVLTVLGNGLAGLAAVVIVTLYSAFLVAQVLRVSRRHHRHSELLRTYVESSRESLTASLGVYEKGLANAQAEMSAQLSVSRAELLDGLAGTTSRIKATEETMQSAVLGGYDRAVSEVQEGLRTRLSETQDSMRLISEDSKSRIEASVKRSLTEVRHAQQLISQKVMAHQDGIRSLVDAVAKQQSSESSASSALRQEIEAIRSSLEADAGGASIGDVARSVSELACSVDAMQDGLTLIQSRIDGVAEEKTVWVGEAERLSRNFRPAVDYSVGDIADRLESLREKAGEPIEEIDLRGPIDAHFEGRARVWRLVRSIHASSTLTEEQREAFLSIVYPVLGAGDVKQEFVLEIDKYGIGVSFRSQMVRLLLLKQRLLKYGYELSPRLNDKVADHTFARMLGVATPKVRARHVSIEDLVVTPGTIIKPSVGEDSVGVFFVRSDSSLMSIRNRRIFRSAEDAFKALSRSHGSLNASTWIVEDAVLGEDRLPARDLKVYMFYGRLAMFIEISRGTREGGGNITYTYDADGRPIRYRATDSMPDHEVGVPDRVVEMARRISSASPMPFLRVDFLLGADGPVLGEITPHPGGIYAGDADDLMDRRLGELFLDADARLTVDLLNGKSFSDYFSAYPARVDSDQNGETDQS